MLAAGPRRLFLDFDGGDGDQSLFAVPFLAEASSEVWTTEEDEDRLSLKVLNGPCAGETIHVASRLIETLSEQIASNRLLSVVVYRGDKPSPVGMAIPELLLRNG